MSVLGIGSLLIAPLCLLYVDKELLFPFITGKNFFWRFFITVGFVAWAALALFKNEYRFSIREPFFIALSIFMGLILVSNMLGHDWYYAFWSGAERMDGYVSLIYLYIFFLLIRGFIQTKQRAHLFLGHLLGLGLVIAVVGWGQNEIDRIYSTLGNPIYLASLSLFGIFFSGYFLVQKEKMFGFSQTWRIVFFSIIALLFFYTIFRTGTRGALLGLVGGGFATCGLFALLIKDKADRWWKYLGMTGVALVLIAGGLFFGAREQLAQLEVVQSSNLLSRAINISTEDKTTSSRLTNWEMALRGSVEKPVFGWGQENYAPVFSKYYDVVSLYDDEQWFDRTHNTFLDWLVFGGILGLVSYLSLFVLIFFILWKKTPLGVLEKSVISGLFVAYLFQNIVAFDSLVSGIYLYASFAFVTLLSKGSSEKSEKEINKLVKYITIVALVCGSLWWIWYSIYLPRETSKDYIDYFIASNNRTVESATAGLVYFEQAFDHKTYMTRELTLQALQRKQYYIIPGIAEETLSVYLTTVVENANWVLDTYNNPVKFQVVYGSFLLDIGATADAIPVIENALLDSPQKATIKFLLATAYERNNEIEKGRELLESVVNQVPEYEQAQTLLRAYNERNPE